MQTDSLEPCKRYALALFLMLAFQLSSFAQEDEESDHVDFRIEPRYAQRVDEVRQSGQVEIAMQHLIELGPRSLNDLIELTEIPAPPFAEGDRGLRFAELLRESGLKDVSIDEVGNVIGKRPGRGGSRVIALLAHLDTVFPAGTDVTVRQQGDTYFAPGIGDNTRGLVVILGVLRALEHAAIQTEADIWFVGNVGEEGLGDLRGVKHLFRQGTAPIDALIAIDGGETSRVVYGGVGSHRYRVVFSGPGGHSWGAFGTANPHHALARAIALFDEAADPITRDGQKSSYNIGRMGGGTSINSIPFESWAEVDIRSGDPVKIAAIDEVLQQSIQSALDQENAGRRRGPELTVEAKLVGVRPAAPGNLESPLVQRAMAVLSSFAVEPEPSISSTDANLPLSLGIPAVTLSRGGVSGDAHSPQEWWQDKDSHIGMQAAFLTTLIESGFVN